MVEPAHRITAIETGVVWPLSGKQLNDLSHLLNEAVVVTLDAPDDTPIMSQLVFLRFVAAVQHPDSAPALMLFGNSSHKAVSRMYQSLNAYRRNPALAGDVAPRPVPYPKDGQSALDTVLAMEKSIEEFKHRNPKF